MYTTTKTLEKMRPLGRKRRQNCEEAYLEVADIIRATVAKFTKTHGGDYYEHLADANSIFMGAWHRFDGSSPFQFWIRKSIVNGLIDKYRAATRQKNMPNMHGFAHSCEVPARRSFDQKGYLESLSDDARTIVNLVLDTPRDLQALIQPKGYQGNYLTVIRQRLEKCGWSAARIADSLFEIRNS